MTTPRTRQADDLIGYLKRRDWGELRRQMHEALRRAESPGPKRDGMDRTGEAGVRGGGVSDRTSSAATSRDQRDQVRDHTQRAARHLEEAVLHVQAWAEQLAAIEALVSDEGLNPEPGCWAMARVGQWEAVHARPVVDGEVRPLGHWAYRFLRRTGRLPTRDECQRHADGRLVRVSAS